MGEAKSTQKSKSGSKRLGKSTHSSTSSSSPASRKRSSKRLDPRLLPVLTPPAEDFLSHTYEPVSPASTSTSTAMSSNADSSTPRYGSASSTDSASTPSSRSVSGSSSATTAGAGSHDDNCHFAFSPELRTVDRGPGRRDELTQRHLLKGARGRSLLHYIMHHGGYQLVLETHGHCSLNGVNGNW